jgi:hypothetical protein
MRVLAVTGLVTSVMLVSAVWGYAASWVNQLIKQTGFPHWLNAVIANVVVIVSAAMATIQSDVKFTLAAFGSALLAAFSAALINHSFVLPIGGVGEKLKSATSIVK